MHTYRVTSPSASARAARAIWVWLGVVLAVIGFSSPAFAEFKPPALDGHVVDTANALTRDQVLALDRKLEDVRIKHGFEIVAFIAGSLDGEAKEDVAYTCFNTWKLGKKGADNGVLLLIAPNERKAFLATGKGVEGALTDLQSDDILTQQVIPALKENRIYDAADHGTSAIARTLSGAPGAAGAPGTSTGKRPAASEPLTTKDILIIVGVVVVMIFLSIVSSTFRSILGFVFRVLLFSAFRGGGGSGGDSGSGFSGGGGSSGGGGAGEDY